MLRKGNVIAAAERVSADSNDTAVDVVLPANNSAANETAGGSVKKGGGRGSYITKIFRQIASKTLCTFIKCDELLFRSLKSDYFWSTEEKKEPVDPWEDEECSDATGDHVPCANLKSMCSVLGAVAFRYCRKTCGFCDGHQGKSGKPSFAQMMLGIYNFFS